MTCRIEAGGCGYQFCWKVRTLFRGYLCVHVMTMYGGVQCKKPWIGHQACDKTIQKGSDWNTGDLGAATLLLGGGKHRRFTLFYSKYQEAKQVTVRAPLGMVACVWLSVFLGH